MGIFSSLFSRDDEDLEEESSQTEEERPRKPSVGGMVPRGQPYEGMRLDVSTEDRKPLFSGRITELSSDALTLERLPGALSFKICNLGSTVQLNGYDRRMIGVSLRGTVESSGRTMFKVKDLQTEILAEHRESFRLLVNAPASLYRQDDEHYRHPEECVLVDLSAGGACIQSEYVHVEDEVLRLRIQLAEYAPLNYMGQIIRCSEQESGQFQYGFLFAQLTEEEISTLNKMLFNLQTGNRQVHTRTEIGHW